MYEIWIRELWFVYFYVNVIPSDEHTTEILLKFGYNPAEPVILKLFIYLFLHANFWHILGNSIFLLTT